MLLISVLRNYLARTPQNSETTKGAPLISILQKLSLQKPQNLRTEKDRLLIPVLRKHLARTPQKRRAKKLCPSSHLQKFTSTFSFAGRFRAAIFA